ncbi:MAG TPA: aldehyde dehydrogenase family protein [Acidimicrobiales bacterium]
MDQTPVRIAGEKVHTNGSVDVTNPFGGDVIAAVPLCGPDEVESACTSARAAFERNDFPQHQRAEVLDRAAVLLADRNEDFARRIMLEAGKPIRTARTEARRAVDTFRFAAAEARRLGGEVVSMEASESGAGKIGFALRVPAGVVAAITPFNFPLNLVAHKVAPAIAAGCPVVLKPAPQTPLTALALVEMLLEAGLPLDWISTVTDSGKEAGAPLVEHPVPEVITFTGSGPVGWSISAAAPRKKVLLELGSNSPLIVEPECDVLAIAAKVKVAGFSHAGQSCISVQRVLVHRDAHAPMVEALADAASSLVVGDPADEATDLGPMIAPGETMRVRGWVDEAVSAGGRVVTGGGVVDGAFQATVVDGAPSTTNLWTREVFGPVITVAAYDDFDHALALANGSDFGLHAGVFTNDISKALQAVRELDFGGVLINEVPTFRADQQPYGGVGDAGNTREGPAYAVEEMTRLRFVSLQP